MRNCFPAPKSYRVKRRTGNIARRVAEDQRGELVINNELIARNDELNSARFYAEGIINTIRDPLVILDEHLKCSGRRKVIIKSFRLTKNDTEGQFLYHVRRKPNGIFPIKELAGRSAAKASGNHRF